MSFNKKFQFTKIRKLQPIEEFYEIAQNDFKFMISCYLFKCESKADLELKDVQKTLSILFRSFDVLSICIREEGEELWYCRMAEEKIDFQVMDEADTSEILETETCCSFMSKEGPLWRMKMIRRAVSVWNNHTESEPSNKITYFILSIHHGITDGSTSFRICNAFTEILNDVISGSDKDVYEYGKFSKGETKQILNVRKAYLESNPELFNELKTELNRISKLDVLINDIFPVTPNLIPKTKHIMRDLSLDDTQKLIQKFRSNNITFHAGFTAVANWALMELFEERSYSKDVIEIGSFHAINARRYWEKDTDTCFPQGCHILPLRITVKTPRNVGQIFYSYAQSIAERLQNFMKDFRPLDEVLAFPLTNSEGFAGLFKNVPPLYLYFSTTNMGDVSSILPSDREHVNITWLTRSTSCHEMNISMIHILHTYMGVLMYSLDYSTRFVTEDLATKYVDKIFDLVQSLLNECPQK